MFLQLDDCACTGGNHSSAVRGNLHCGCPPDMVPSTRMACLSCLQNARYCVGSWYLQRIISKVTDVFNVIAKQPRQSDLLVAPGPAALVHLKAGCVCWLCVAPNFSAWIYDCIDGCRSPPSMDGLITDSIIVRRSHSMSCCCSRREAGSYSLVS